MIRKRVARRRARPRSGAIMVMAVVALMLVTTFTAMLLQATVKQRRHVRTQSHVAQSKWLAESGLERAMARLREDPQYAGEVWELGNDMPGSLPATVTIKVTPVDDMPRLRSVEVVAVYAANLEQDAGFQTSRSWKVRLSNTEN